LDRPLFGGLALFLFGMDIMTSALKRATGDYLKDLLGRLARSGVRKSAISPPTHRTV
jgi:Na+/phosphate symporter